VGQAFEQLAVGLDEFITRVLAPDLAEGSDWTLVLAAKDAQRGGRSGTYDRHDPQCSLRTGLPKIMSTRRPESAL